MDATLITALATFVTAVTALIKVLQVQREGQAVHRTLRTVDTNTNGALASLQQNVVDLRGQLATPVELASRDASSPSSDGSA